MTIFVRPTKPGPYIARSASDKTEDWPLWYVAGPDGRTNYLTDLGFATPKPDGSSRAIFTTRDTAEELANTWNTTSGEAMTDTETSRVQALLDANEAEITRLKVRDEKLRHALEPLMLFLERYEAKPLGGMADTIYGIHSGTAWEATISLSDFRNVRAALSAKDA